VSVKSGSLMPVSPSDDAVNKEGGGKRRRG